MNSESFKGGVHFLVGGFAFAFALYNTMQYGATKQRRNLFNACAYTALFGLEYVNTAHHWRKSC